MERQSDLLQQGIMVHNAGLVLLNAYMPMLFERLGLIKNNAFVSVEAQTDAVHYV